MEKRRRLIRIGHGQIPFIAKELPPHCPTILTNVACWHILIEESEMNCNEIGKMSGGRWDKVIEQNKRVYDESGAAPTLTTMSGGNTEIKVLNSDRVRKLTENECGKLMGVKKTDRKRLSENLSKSAQYHCYGDSIVTTCLMAIFGKALGIDYETKISEFSEELANDKTKKGD